MNINIRIGKLVIHGFNYYDHKRISSALEQEMARLIKENGLSGSFAQEGQISQLDVPSFNAAKDMNPRTIGTRVAQSLYEVFRPSFRETAIATKKPPTSKS